MKRPLALTPVLLPLLLLATAPLVASAAESVPVIKNEVTVSESVALTRGYEEAFRAMTAKLVVIHWRFNGREMQTREVVSVKAAGGVLLVQVVGLDRIAIPAESVTAMVDGIDL